jgi:LPS sulfotransferase NodH
MRRRRPERFVLVSTQRSGSTWVVDMLESHPRVTCFGALFLPTGTGPHPVGAQMPYFCEHLAERGGTSRLGRPLAEWRFLDHVFRSGGDAGSVGFKFMYSQFRLDPWVLAYVALKRIRVVHLIRRNKLDHVISKETAKARGRYHMRVGESFENPKVRLDPAEVLRQLDWEETKVRRAGRVLRALRVPLLEVYYEDLVADPGRYADVLRFVGVDGSEAELKTSLQKWNRRRYDEAIENFDAVRAALAGTPYERLLEPAAR